MVFLLATYWLASRTIRMELALMLVVLLYLAKTPETHFPCAKMQKAGESLSIGSSDYAIL